MKRIAKSSGGVAVDRGETTPEVSDHSITEFRQALSELAIAAEESTNPSRNAMLCDQILAYVSRLAAILQDMAVDPNAADVLCALSELRIDMVMFARELQRHGSLH